MARKKRVKEKGGGGNKAISRTKTNAERRKLCQREEEEEGYTSGGRKEGENRESLRFLSFRVWYRVRVLLATFRFPSFFSLSRAHAGGRENWCFAEKNFSTTTATACGAKKGAIWGNCVFSGVKFVRYSFGKTGKQLKTFFWAYFSPGMNVSSVLPHCSFSSVFFLDSFQVPKASACLSLALAACDVKGRNIFSNGVGKDVGCVFRF